MADEFLDLEGERLRRERLRIMAGGVLHDLHDAPIAEQLDTDALQRGPFEQALRKELRKSWEL